MVAGVKDRVSIAAKEVSQGAPLEVTVKIL